MRHVLSLGVIVATLLAGAATAGAQPGGNADRQALALYEQGSAAYTEGRYEDAVRAFSDAYRLSPRPLLLFNLANAYERIGQYDAAVRMLEGFLPHAPVQERAILQTRVANLRARAEAAEAAAARGGDSVLVPVGIGVGAGGVALLAAGVAFGVLALDAREGAQSLCRTGPGGLLCMGGTDAQLADAELFALLADIGIFGGGALAATGLVLIIVGAAGGGGGGEGGAAWIEPDVQAGPGGVSVGARGRF